MNHSLPVNNVTTAHIMRLCNRTLPLKCIVYCLHGHTLPGATFTPFWRERTRAGSRNKPQTRLCTSLMVVTSSRLVRCSMVQLWYILTHNEIYTYTSCYCSISCGVAGPTAARIPHGTGVGCGPLWLPGMLPCPLPPLNTACLNTLYIKYFVISTNAP